MRCALAVAALLLPVACAQDDAESRIELLARVHERMSRAVRRTPAYVCTEQAREVALSNRPKSPERHPRSTTIEVAMQGGAETFSWPGENEFRSFESFGGGARLTLGTYASLLYSVFAPDDVSFEYQGEDALARGSFRKFGFKVPEPGWSVSFGKDRASARCEGSFWVDPATAEVVAIEASAAGLPATFPLAELKSVIQYDNVQLGGEAFLLPVSVVNTATLRDGGRLVRADIVLNDHRPYSAAAADSRAEWLPAGLTLEAALDREIDFQALPAGSPVSATLRRAVEGGFPLPQGAKLAGILVRREDLIGGTVGEIRFSKIASGGNTFLLRAGLDSIGSLPGIGRDARDAAPDAVRIGVLAGVRIPAGFKIVLKTVAAATGPRAAGP